MKDGLRERLRWIFQCVGVPLAIHEIPSEYKKYKGEFIGYTENSIGAMLRVMTQQGIFQKRMREKKNYKEWYMVKYSDQAQKQTTLL